MGSRTMMGGQDRTIIGEHATAAAALLTGATVWGLIWYPYRLVETAGLGGIRSCVLTYAVALGFALIAFQATARSARFSWWLPLIALAACGCNLGYIMAVLRGEVMRVLLLFYLAPLWTVLLSRLLLGERLTRRGMPVILLSLAGAMVMLWHPARGMPWPGNTAEWIALGAGFSFALQNVLIRRASTLPIELKSIAVLAGVVFFGLLLLPLESGSGVSRLTSGDWLVLGLIGIVLLVVNLVVQYGLVRIVANQASVIYLFELVVAAASSWLLAGEAMGPREWVGGSMIIAASLFSGRLAVESHQEDPRQPG